MLYWAIFTSGFIIGGVIASFVFDGISQSSIQKSSSGLANPGSVEDRAQ